jgi:hypothetical protein
MHNHLCFFKQISGTPPKQRLQVESSEGYGESHIETDLGLQSLIANIKPQEL